MKNYVIILTLCLISFTGFSQAIKPYGMFETGYENRQTMFYTTEYERFVLGILPTNIVKPFFGSLHAGVSYKGFEVHTISKTYFSKDRSIYFDPMLVEYKIGASYSYKFIKIGYEHMCAHTVAGLKFSDMYDRISVRFVIGTPDKNTW